MWTPYFNFDMFAPPPGLKSEQLIKVMQDTELRKFIVQFFLSDIRLMRSEVQLLLPDISSGQEVGVPFRKITKLVLATNDDKKLSSIILLTESSSPVDAIRWCYNPVCQLLSHWSFQNGGSFTISGAKVKDINHNVVLKTKPDTGVAAIALAPMFIPSRFDLDDRHRAMLSMYRECRNSSSPFYSLLCSYKILEAVFQGEIFVETDNTIKNLGVNDEREPGNISKEMLITARANMLHENYAGLSFKSFMKKVKKTKNGVAHALLRKGDMYDFDHIEHYTEVAITASLADLVAREILEEEFRLMHVIDVARAQAEGKEPLPAYFLRDRFIYPKLVHQYQEDMRIDFVKKDSHGNKQE